MKINICDVYIIKIAYIKNYTKIRFDKSYFDEHSANIKIRRDVLITTFKLKRLQKSIIDCCKLISPD
jgi:hypothetical protein